MAKAPHAAPAETAAAVPATISERALSHIQELGGKRFEIVKTLSRPTLKFEEDNAVYVKFIQPLTPPEKDADGKIVVRNNMESPWTGIVIDMNDGVEKNLVLNKVFVGELNRSYPDNSYVNKPFAAFKHPKEKGKRYHHIEIAELREVG